MPPLLPGGRRLADNEGASRSAIVADPLRGAACVVLLVLRYRADMRRHLPSGTVPRLVSRAEAHLQLRYATASPVYDARAATSIRSAGSRSDVRIVGVDGRGMITGPPRRCRRRGGARSRRGQITPRLLGPRPQGAHRGSRQRVCHRPQAAPRSSVRSTRMRTRLLPGARAVWAGCMTGN
jgi:hypothetical protein